MYCPKYSENFVSADFGEELCPKIEDEKFSAETDIHKTDSWK
jgi:hypothetical protein